MMKWTCNHVTSLLRSSHQATSGASPEIRAQWQQSDGRFRCPLSTDGRRYGLAFSDWMLGEPTAAGARSTRWKKRAGTTPLHPTTNISILYIYVGFLQQIYTASTTTISGT